MAIRPKEGRYYKDGLGGVGGPAEHSGREVYPWLVRFGFDDRVYTDDGQYHVSCAGWRDLVSECDAEGNPIEDEAMTEAAQLVMKEGAYYEDGEGDVGGPASLDVDRDDGYFWAVPFPSGPRRYSRKGVCFNKFFQRRDLVREVPTPSAPEAPKPETITQEMVDRAILDAVKAGDASRAVEIHDAWDDLRRVMQQKAEQQDKPQTADGWLPWEGGECPVDEVDVIDIRFRDGSKELGLFAGEVNWEHESSPFDVKYYRPAKPEGTSRNATAEMT